MEALLLMELLDSSSSESESSDEEFLEIIKTLFHKKKNNNFIKDKDFRQKFRLSRQTARKLINMYKCSRHFKERIGFGGKSISAETQCLAFLWFVGNKDSFREVSNLFNFSLPSAFRILTNFLEFMREISKEYIKFPSTADEKEKTAQELAKLAGLENVLGCIDCSYIKIRRPANQTRSTYTHRNGMNSIILQGICDANELFLNVFIVSPCKLPISSIYELSSIAKKIPTICGSQYHILGEAAYPLREYLLTPYEEVGDMTDQQKMYNEKQFQTRAKMRNSFGLLKQRFRQLTNLEHLTTGQMCRVVLSCCVLHNFCNMEGDTWDTVIRPQEESDEVIAPNDSLNEAVLQRFGRLKRNEISGRF